MFFSTKPATMDNIYSPNLENVLNQVTQAITRNHIGHNNEDNDSSFGCKMNLLNQDYQAGQLPNYNNYWLAQEDPHFAKQAEKEADIPRLSKKGNSPNPFQGVLMSRDDIDRAFHDHYQMGGTSGKMDGAFSNIQMLGSTLSLKQKKQRINKAMREARPRDAM